MNFLQKHIKGEYTINFTMEFYTFGDFLLLMSVKGPFNDSKNLSSGWNMSVGTSKLHLLFIVNSIFEKP